MSKASTLQWVTGDGVSGGNVTVLVQAPGYGGRGSIAESPGVSGTGRKNGRGSSVIAEQAVIYATSAVHGANLLTTVRWVTSDGISGGDVVVTVVAEGVRIGRGTIAETVSVTSTGVKNAVGNGEIPFYVTFTGEGVRYRIVTGVGVIAETATLAGTGTKAVGGYGLILPLVAFQTVGAKGALGTGTFAAGTALFTGSGGGTGVANRMFVFALSGGGDAYLGLRGSVIGVLGSLSGGGDGTFTGLMQVRMQLLHLVWHGSVDDHPRPKDPLWRRFAYPRTQTALLLYRDGTVQEVASLTVQNMAAADDVVAGGHRSMFFEGSWQVEVLLAAGYMLEPAGYELVSV